MAALISSVMNTKDVCHLRQRLRRDGIECFRRRQLLAVRLRRSRGQDPLRPERRQGVGSRRHERSSAPASRVALHLRLGFRRAHRSRLRQQRVLEALVKCGAFDSTAPRARECSNCSTRSSPGGRSRPPTGWPGRARSSTCSRRPRPARAAHPEIANEEYEKPELLKLEKEVLGLYVSEHPLHAIRDQLRRKTTARCPSSTGAVTARSWSWAGSSAPCVS